VSTAAGFQAGGAALDRTRRRERAQTPRARTSHLTQQPKQNIIPLIAEAPQGGRHQIGTLTGLGSERVAGLIEMPGSRCLRLICARMSY